MSQQSTKARRHTGVPRPTLSARRIIDEHFDEVAEQEEERRVSAMYEEMDGYYNYASVYADVGTSPFYREPSRQEQDDFLEALMDDHDRIVDSWERSRYFYDPPLPDAYDGRLEDAWANSRYGD